MLNKLERKLLAALLKRAADEFSNHCCNDIDIGPFGFSKDQCREFWQKLAEWSGDLELSEQTGSYFYDWMLMEYFADMIQSDD